MTLPEVIAAQDTDWRRLKSNEMSDESLQERIKFWQEAARWYARRAWITKGIYKEMQRELQERDAQWREAHLVKTPAKVLPLKVIESDNDPRPNQ